MSHVKMLKERTVKILDGEGKETGRTKTYPFGWQGVVDDQKLVADMEKNGEAEVIGTRPEAGQPGSDTHIPDNWADLNADDMIALAHRLGAPGEVNTKAAAVEFITPLAKTLV